VGLSSLKKKNNTVSLKQNSSLQPPKRSTSYLNHQISLCSKLSSSKKNPDHVIHSLLPPPKAPGYNLRKRSHGLLLPNTQSNLLHKDFIYVMLFKRHLLVTTCFHRRNNRGDRGRQVPPQLLGWGTNNVLVPLNFLAVVVKKQEISQQVLLLLNETQSFHINYSALRRHFSRYATNSRRKKTTCLIPVSTLHGTYGVL